VTSHKDRACSNRAKERQQRTESWVDPCCDDLHDAAPADARFSIAAPSDWAQFVRRLENLVYSHLGLTCLSTPAIDKLRELFSSTDFAHFSQIHARSLNQELRDHFGMLCCDGSIEAARLFMTAGGRQQGMPRSGGWDARISSSSFRSRTRGMAVPEAITFT
jgi:hypothetical protein